MQTIRNPYIDQNASARTRALRLRLFTDEIYGRAPSEDVELHWEVVRVSPLSDGGARRQVVLEIATDRGRIALTLLIHLPPVELSGGRPAVERRVPAFVGMNFRGNHTCADDPGILDLTHPADDSIGDRLDYEGRRESFKVPAPRGSQAGRWAVSRIVERNYVSVTWSYFQVGPDSPDVFARGPQRLFRGSGFDDRAPSDWGSIGMWAWSMSRVLDAIEAGMVPEIDPTAVIAHGHSRLGKTALWAAACDRRFAAAISNDSGAMGAALSRPVGETPEVLARIRPQWFARRFSERIRAGRPLPVDQHELLALIAPRPVYVSSASQDSNADPEGEFLSWRQASIAWSGDGRRVPYRFPAPGTVHQPQDVPLGYHLRDGKHDVTSFDWEAWLDWADRWVHPHERGASASAG